MNDTRNMILAVALSLGILIAWHLLYERPQLEAQKQMALQQPAIRPGVDGTTPKVKLVTHEEAVAATASSRVKIESSLLKGSIQLTGARIDDLTLKTYTETIDPKSPQVTLLTPSGTNKVYFAEFGWLNAGDSKATLPTPSTRWQADRNQLTPGTPVTLSWKSPEGLTFRIKIALDEHYMFTITRSVTNASGKAVTLSDYGLLSRTHEESKHYAILQEGPLLVVDKKLEEEPFHKLKEDREKHFEGSGWVGVTDKYWLAAMIPARNESFASNLTYYLDTSAAVPVDRFQADYTGNAFTVNAGETKTLETHFYAGAKKLDLLNAYQEKLGVPLFERAIDFGWFYFLTKPMFHSLNWLNSHIHHFGIALLVLTVCIKLLMFPLANKSYRSMSQMKQLHPKIVALKERHGDDKLKMNQAVMELYKKERINPLSGCLPILVQIPVFFALYKVLFITIEMRHAPFYGWIHDLSAPDPTNLFNLFGLIPYELPTFLHIGLWPLIMGATMVIQQSLNPPPPDPVQAKVIKMMPYFMVFVFASFPAGLVIYWSWSNTLSILQQWYIMKSVKRDAKKKEAKHALVGHSKDKKSHH